MYVTFVLTSPVQGEFVLPLEFGDSRIQLNEKNVIDWKNLFVLFLSREYKNE